MSSKTVTNINPAYPFSLVKRFAMEVPSLRTTPAPWLVRFVITLVPALIVSILAAMPQPFGFLLVFLCFNFLLDWRRLWVAFVCTAPWAVLLAVTSEQPAGDDLASRLDELFGVRTRHQEESTEAGVRSDASPSQTPATPVDDNFAEPAAEARIAPGDQNESPPGQKDDSVGKQGLPRQGGAKRVETPKDQKPASDAGPNDEAQSIKDPSPDVLKKPSPPAARGAPTGEKSVDTTAVSAAKWYYRGSLAYDRGDYDEAMKAFEESLRLQPGDPDALRGLQLVKKAQEKAIMDMQIR